MKRTALMIVLTVILTTSIYLIVRQGGSPHPSAIGNRNVTVSILPLKYIIDRISGGTLEVDVIVPPGSGPETYEPTPRQLKRMDDSGIIFVTGLLDMESSLSKKISSGKIIFVDLSEGIEVIEGHHHHHGHDHHSHLHHIHGADPHIWSSPRCLKVMSRNAYNTLVEVYPADSELFIANYLRLVQDLEDLDMQLKEKIHSSGKKSFLIYHPALTYYSRDYGIEQIQLEQDGKEPSADQLKKIIDRAKAEGLDKILYQKEFSVKSVEAVAKNIGARPVEIDPLSEDVLENIWQITVAITE